MPTQTPCISPSFQPRLRLMHHLLPGSPGTRKRAAGMAIIIGLITSTGNVALAATPHNIQLRANHPDSYTVVKGDTLWSIAQHFLASPWQWKSVWKQNPSIKNPNLIYPGDRIALSMVNGHPSLSVAQRGRRVIKLSPGVRAHPLNEAVTAFPIESIKHFLSRTQVIDKGQRSTAPYLMGAVGERLVLGSANERAYVRGISNRKIRRYGLYDVGEPYIDPDLDEDNVLGLEAVYLGSARVEKPGDPTIVRIEEATRELTEGALLLPLDTESEQWSFSPHPVEATQKATIISVVDGVTQVSQFDIIAINAGRDKGIEPGHVMMGLKHQGTVEDPEAKRQVSRLSSSFFDILTIGSDEAAKASAKAARDNSPKAARMSRTVDLPSEPAGTVMVFQVFEKMSFALVMQTREPLEIGDKLVQPIPGAL